MPAEQGGHGTKGSDDRTISRSPPTLCACPAEYGAEGDGPQRRLFSGSWVCRVWPAPQLERSASENLA